MKLVSVKNIRYIKLGEGGKWAKDCFNKGIIRLGYSSGAADVFNAATAGKWKDVENFWLAKDKPKAVATGFTNQTKEFFDDDGSTLWITFEDGFLYHCFSDGGAVEQDTSFINEARTTYRKTKNGWSNHDANGLPLKVTQLSGMITKTQGYRGTICKFTPQPEADDYLRTRIAGKVSENIYKAESAKKDLMESIKPLVKSLTPKDFEILCELIFSNSGWRRTSGTGGVQKTIDIELENPVTGDAAFVQIKTKTTQKEFEDYISKKQASHYDRMFYVYHSGDIVNSMEDSEISVWDLNKVAEQVLSSGLVDWVIAHSK